MWDTAGAVLPFLRVSGRPPRGLPCPWDHLPPSFWNRVVPEGCREIGDFSALRGRPVRMNLTVYH